jgi:hypothetical protein
MHFVRTLTVAFSVSALALAGAACKRGPETFQSPGVDRSEIDRQGTPSSHDHTGASDPVPAATPEEARDQAAAEKQPPSLRDSFRAPGLSVEEARERGIIEGQGGVGGGPTDEPLDDDHDHGHDAGK